MEISILKTENGDDSFIGAKLISPEICDKLIEEFENCPFGKNKYSGAVGGTVQPEIKKSTDVITNMEKTPFYSKEILKAATSYGEHYGEVLMESTAPWGFVEPYNIQKYNPGEGFYKYHYESSGFRTSSRLLVFMTYLNDVEDGGTEFLYQKIKTNSIKGLTLIWPAGFTHTHRGVISKNETKYIATGWINILPDDLANK